VLCVIRLEKENIGPREPLSQRRCETCSKPSSFIELSLTSLPLQFPHFALENQNHSKTGIDIGGSDDGTHTGPQQLSAPSSREARGGNVSAVASRLKPEFLKGQRAYLVGTSCYLPPKEDFVHKTFLINAIRKSVSCLLLLPLGVKLPAMEGEERKEGREGAWKLIEW